MDSPFNLELPRCETCDACLSEYTKTRDGAFIRERLLFGCGGSKVRTWKPSFKAEFPDGELTTWGTPGQWNRKQVCGNAEEVVANLRDKS